MEIPLSIEVIISIALFAIAGVGSIIAYFISNLQKEIGTLNDNLSVSRDDRAQLNTRMKIVETKMSICSHCPNPVYSDRDSTHM